MAVCKQYTMEFKHEAVRLVTEQELSIAQVAQGLGLNDNLLSGWKRDLTQQGEHAFPGQGHAQKDELAWLRREIEVLRREREILTKAVGYLLATAPVRYQSIQEQKS